MTFSEKLEIAKTGSKAAYESLCAAFVDSLYTAALISLKDGQAAKNSVIIAIAEGYAGISRIKDEKHLCSWLVHELTKNVVDTLKEFRAQGVESGAGGIFAVTADMPDVERLIFAVSAVFGYGSREISVLTGMSENAVDSKLRSARAHLGRDYDAVAAAAAAYLAPESLKARYPEFDESKVIHKDENDEASTEVSPAGAAEPAPAEEPAVSASADTAGYP
nr:sigma-70 region 4 domain-containing protein [Ruminiclostridium sp.]